MREIVLIAHDIRSTHNVGSLLRTAEGLGVKKIIFSGYTPYPSSSADDRMPHLSNKINHQISKTALGAEALLPWEISHDIYQTMTDLKNESYHLIGLEQSKTSIPLPELKPQPRIAILLGREVEGIDTELLKCCDALVEIPMFGKKESFNVVQAAAMILYHCRFTDK